MPVFNNYAKFYDALYAVKNYAAECSFLEAIMAKYSIQPVQTILDLGCGTGGHVLELTQRGYNVCGLDQSKEMLTLAEKKNSNLAKRGKVTFQEGDIRNFKLNQKFDMVISMFAVISYMTSNEDVQMALKTARRHLTPNGLFVFDIWHGPGALVDPPVDRYMIVQQENSRVIRFVHPITNITSHTVDVNYKLLNLEGEKLVSEVDETHVMRFFFPQEIIFHLLNAGFEVLRLCSFMELDHDLNEHDWTITVIAKAI
jgi:SAM-dependent methyltransferase